jgi:5-methylcytosine-specific restriction endonuclease McrA
VWNAWVPGAARAGEGACACCGRSITQQDFECGHVVAAARGGSTRVDNMRPVCRACNRSMGVTDMREFAAAHFGP